MSIINPTTIIMDHINHPGGLCRSIFVVSIVFFTAFLFLSNNYPNCSTSDFFSPLLKPAKQSLSTNPDSPTLLSHLAFGLVGSEDAWHHRHAYIESWWLPQRTKGYLFLDRAPKDSLLPWSPSSPPYRISRDLKKMMNKTDVTPYRIAYGIMEAFKALDNENMRWLVMGDDDSIIFVDNLLVLLSQYDHTKYYYFGTKSEFILSNHYFSFSQAFGGAGFVLSYPLAKAMAEEMDNCLIKYRYLNAADKTTMSCIADLGVSLTNYEGFHQMDLRGDVSGLLSSHPRVPVVTLHHFDMVEPIFPSMDRFQSTRHLMKAARVDQSRMLQQTVCYVPQLNWSISVSWGYSAHIYEKIIPRSLLQYPIETFDKWLNNGPGPPFYMFNTRPRSTDPCQAPHVFFFDEITSGADQVFSLYKRSKPRGTPPCASTGNHSADLIAQIRVYSPTSRRLQIDRSECCDVVGLEDSKASVKYRECNKNDALIPL